MQPIRFHLIAATFAAFVAVPVAAQEATTPAEVPAEAPAETPAETAPAADPSATTAEPAAPEAPAGGAAAPAAPGGEAAAPAAPADGGAPAQSEVMEVIRETFGDWQVRCAPEGSECFIYQLALDASENPVAEVSILKLPDEAEADAGVTIVTPLGTLLPNGVVMQIDGGERRQYPFAWCSQVGCFARFGLANTTITAMKRGSSGSITLVSVGAPEEPVRLALSLTGFTAAYDSLTVPTAPTEPEAPLAPAAPAAPAN